MGSKFSLQGDIAVSMRSFIPANTNQVKNLLSTSVVKGCDVTINSGDNKKADISSGIVRYVDNTTDAQLPNFKGDKFFPGATAVSMQSAFTSTKISIQEDLTVLTEGAPPFGVDNAESRDRVDLATAIHFGDNPIQIIAPSTGNLGVDLTAILGDFMRAVGHIRKTGLKVTPNGANLSIDLSFGTEFSQFSPERISAPKNPTNDGIGAKTPASFFHSWQDGSGGWNASSLTTFINVDVFDDGTGGASEPNGAIGPAKAGIWRVYEVNESVGVLYPQQFYNGLSDALDSLPTEVFEQSTFFEATSFRGSIIILGSAAALDNVSQALFFDPSTDFVETRL